MKSWIPVLVTISLLGCADRAADSFSDRDGSAFGDGYPGETWGDPDLDIAGLDALRLGHLLAQVRRATAKYHDPEVALADGFIDTGFCVSGPPEEGDMGIHFVDFDRVGATYDPLRPNVLVYEWRGGHLHLVAVEYLVVGPKPKPFGGLVDFKPGPPGVDYALHAWVWRANTNGIFAEFNPKVECEQ